MRGIREVGVQTVTGLFNFEKNKDTFYPGEWEERENT